MNSLDKYTLLYDLQYRIFAIRLARANAIDHLIDDIDNVHIKAARFVNKIKKETLMMVSLWRMYNHFRIEIFELPKIEIFLFPIC